MINVHNGICLVKLVKHRYIDNRSSLNHQYMEVANLRGHVKIHNHWLQPICCSIYQLTIAFPI